MHRPAILTFPESAKLARLAAASAAAIALFSTQAAADAWGDAERAPALLVHSWYEPECCGGGDCHPVPCEELGHDAYDNVTFDDYRFRGSQIRPSRDAHCHVCFHDYYGGIMRRPICVYVQNGT